MCFIILFHNRHMLQVIFYMCFNSWSYSVTLYYFIIMKRVSLLFSPLSYTSLFHHMDYKNCVCMSFITLVIYVPYVHISLAVLSLTQDICQARYVCPVGFNCNRLGCAHMCNTSYCSGHGMCNVAVDANSYAQPKCQYVILKSLALMLIMWLFNLKSGSHHTININYS